LQAELLGLGAVPRFVGERLGAVAADEGDPVGVEVTVEAAPSVLWDALIIPDGADAAEALKANGQVLEFVKDQYRHCKTLLALGTGAEILDAAMIPAALPDGEVDPGVLRMEADEADSAAEAFATALARHRHFARQTDPPAL
jgi:catalase